MSQGRFQYDAYKNKEEETKSGPEKPAGKARNGHSEGSRVAESCGLQQRSEFNSQVDVWTQ